MDPEDRTLHVMMGCLYCCEGRHRDNRGHDGPHKFCPSCGEPYIERYDRCSYCRDTQLVG